MFVLLLFIACYTVLIISFYEITKSYQVYILTSRRSSYLKALKDVKDMFVHTYVCMYVDIY